MSEWIPTAELRWERRPYPLGSPAPTGIGWHDNRSCMVLQQKWLRIAEEIEHEWRDVPIVEKV